MKKQNLILAITLCAILSLPLGEDWRGSIINAQTYIPFPTDSAQWSVRNTINTPFSQSTAQYKMKGDTLLNGITYHKIYYSLDLAYDSPNQTLNCFVREDTTKKVFVKYPVDSGIDTTEFMLYDFNLALGDTVTIRLLHFTTDSLFKFRINNITPYPTLVDTTRKYFELTPIGPNYWQCTVFGGFPWIEGMGAWLTPFYSGILQNGCTDESGGGYEISCFWHKGKYVLGGTFCDYETGINERKTNDDNLQVYPNPANNAINIVFKDKEAIKAIVEIRDVLGKLVERMPLKVGFPYNYTTQSLKPAIYFISLFIDDKFIENKKLVLIK